MSLESRKYVASPTDIENLTRSVLEASITSTEGRSTYLATLIATTQARLAGAPRKRLSSPTKLSPTERDKQLEVLDEVAGLFYDHVKKAARETLKAHNRYSAIEENKRTNFARSSLSILRKWVKVGNDITSLVAGRTSKSMLTVEPRAGRPPSERILKNQFTRIMERLRPVTIALKDADPKAVRAEILRFLEDIDETKVAGSVKRIRSSRELRAED
jgi:hypothetical protein